MRRRVGSLVPLEASILEASLLLRMRGQVEAHGFLLARTLSDREGARRLTAYGTLYKALERLERLGYLESRWEDPLIAAAAGRPRRRFYRTTAVGEQAAVAASEQSAALRSPRVAAAERGT
jgi:PadR family transcriptional regulator, regulatory protein PadR